MMNILINLRQNNSGDTSFWRACLLTSAIVVWTICSFAQQGDAPVRELESKPPARVIGLRYINIHLLQLEKSLKLYREILGFELVDAEVLQHPGIEGMLVMKLRANDLEISLSLTSPEGMRTLKPIGNTNHNHFMLKVNDIGPIGDKLKEEGYELENEHYVRDKYTFFEGPNGEIIGLSSWD